MILRIESASTPIGSPLRPFLIRDKNKNRFEYLLRNLPLFVAFTYQCVCLNCCLKVFSNLPFYIIEFEVRVEVLRSWWGFPDWQALFFITNILVFCVKSVQKQSIYLSDAGEINSYILNQEWWDHWRMLSVEALEICTTLLMEILLATTPLYCKAKYLRNSFYLDWHLSFSVKNIQVTFFWILCGSGVITVVWIRLVYLATVVLAVVQRRCLKQF